MTVSKNPSKAPNIVFLLNDHQVHYRHNQEQYGPRIYRPWWDKLKKKGFNFTNAYTCCPLCGPARRSMLTGLYPHNHKEFKNDVRHNFEHETYLDVLANNGYDVYYFGKWHAGPGTAKDHQCEGFSQENYGNPYKSEEYQRYLKERGLPSMKVRIDKQWMAFYVKLLCRYKEGRKITPNYLGHSGWALGEVTTPKETHEAFFLSELACKKLREIVQSRKKKPENRKPFHLRVDFWGPHQPFFATRKFLDLYDENDFPEHPSYSENLEDKPKIAKKWQPLAKRNFVYPNAAPWPEWQKLLKYHYAQISLIDEAGGKILKTLEELGLDDNTLILWTTDHGGFLGEHGGLFDKDSYMAQELLKIPLVVKPPKKGPNPDIEAINSSKIVSNLDIPQTILDAAGLSFSHKADGNSFLPLIKFDSSDGVPEKIDWREDFMAETHGHIHKHLGRALITERFKYVFNEGDKDELYDLKEDPYEIINQIDNSKYKDVLKKLKARLGIWRSNTGDDLKKKHIKFWREKLKK